MASPITVTGLTNGTAYTFTVKATNAAGSSTASSASNSVTPTYTVPGAPTGVSAIAGYAYATVSFTALASNGAPITSYTVTSNPGNINYSGTASPITVTGLTADTSYNFTVTARNAAGAGPASVPSNSVTPMVALYPVPALGPWGLLIGVAGLGVLMRRQRRRTYEQ